MELFQLSKAAKDDLRMIAQFTEKRWGKIQRNLYIKQFDEIFRLLGDNIEAGVSCNYIRKDYRKFPHNSHVIYYKEGVASHILVVRILHKSMDVNSHTNL
ncbi:MAG: plasmid stabilization protein ParE [Cellvibrio sp. 79]|nr:MAG: plasmid stabilization protein ParE [Cellvibrio sp. 79]